MAIEFYSVFDYKLARLKCEDISIYKNAELVNGLDKLFLNTDLDGCLVDQNGKGLSTFRVPGYWLFNIQGIERFQDWFKNQALLVAEYFGHTGATNISFFRCWTNKIWRGCSGNVHDHDPNSHVIAVFYPSAPEGSADFGLVKDGWQHAKNYEISPENISWQNITEGDCIFHETHAWHTVSEHNSDEPRIVFVLEFSYIKD